MPGRDRLVQSGDESSEDCGEVLWKRIGDLGRALSLSEAGRRLACLPSEQPSDGGAQALARRAAAVIQDAGLPPIDTLTEAQAPP
jgi:hypothetical protein